MASTVVTALEKIPQVLPESRRFLLRGEGGVLGYAEFLQIIADADQEEHESTLRWAGGHFDPETFDPAAVMFDDPENRWKNGRTPADSHVQPAWRRLGAGPSPGAVMNLMQPFHDPGAVGRYTTDTPRKVPGFADLHRMAALLLRESAPDAAEILVLGAGGGLELKALAEVQPRWRFVGVDPSAEMLELARQVVGALGSRIEFQHGRIDEVGAGPFDGATCLLTLHFLDSNERLRTLRALRERLKPSARLVVAHHSVPDGNAERWLARSAAFASGSIDAGMASAATMASRLPILSPEQDEAILHEAGFTDVAMFYAAFSFRGWVATA